MLLYTIEEAAAWQLELTRLCLLTKVNKIISNNKKALFYSMIFISALAYLCLYLYLLLLIFILIYSGFTYLLLLLKRWAMFWWKMYKIRLQQRYRRRREYCLQYNSYSALTYFCCYSRDEQYFDRMHIMRSFYHCTEVLIERH